MDERAAEGRRDFLRTLGRGLALGGGGLGLVAMVRSGRLDVTKCIDEHGPCKKCVLVEGCSLPKAEDFKRSQPHG
jgi:hypothetical protein